MLLCVHSTRRAVTTGHLLLQFRFNGSMVLVLIYGITLTWYVGTDACVNYAVTWYGNPPVSFTIVCFQVWPALLRAWGAAAAHGCGMTLHNG